MLTPSLSTSSILGRSMSTAAATTAFIDKKIANHVCRCLFIGMFSDALREVRLGAAAVVVTGFDPPRPVLSRVPVVADHPAEAVRRGCAANRLLNGAGHIPDLIARRAGGRIPRRGP